MSDELKRPLTKEEFIEKILLVFEDTKEKLEQCVEFADGEWWIRAKDLKPKYGLTLDQGLAVVFQKQVTLFDDTGRRKKISKLDKN
jgi:hypothetical protein